MKAKEISSQVHQIDKGSNTVYTLKKLEDIHKGSPVDVDYEISVKGYYDFQVKITITLPLHKPDTQRLKLNPKNHYQDKTTFFKGNLIYAFDLGVKLNTRKKHITLSAKKIINLEMSIPYTSLNFSTDWSSLKNPNPKIMSHVHDMILSGKDHSAVVDKDTLIIDNQSIAEELCLLLCNDRSFLSNTVKSIKAAYAEQNRDDYNDVIAFGGVLDAGAGVGVFAGAGIWVAFGDGVKTRCGLYVTGGVGAGVWYGISAQAMLTWILKSTFEVDRDAMDNFTDPSTFIKFSMGEGYVGSACLFFADSYRGPEIVGISVGGGVGAGSPFNVYAGAGYSAILEFTATEQMALSGRPGPSIGKRQ